MKTTDCIHRQARGVALLTVLFILVLLTTLVVYMVEDDYLSIRRVSNQRDSEQGYQMAKGAELWAAKVLERDAKQNSTDHLNEPWNRLLPEVGVEEGSLSSTVVDLQGLFNVNNLTAGKDEVWYPAFVRLLSVLDLEEGLADAVLDWIDKDQDITGSNGAEDAEYLSRKPSYRAANRMISDIGELIWINGFNAESLAALAPYITALPIRNLPINVNTCPALLLRILGQDVLSATQAEALMAGRGDEGYPSLREFLSMTELAGQADAIGPMVSVSSGFFQVRSRAQYGRLTSVLYSTMERNKRNAQVVILERRRGTS